MLAANRDYEHEPYAEQARFMVEHQNRFQELKGGRFRSATAEDMYRYCRMLPLFKAALQSTAGLTVDALRAMQEVA